MLLLNEGKLEISSSCYRLTHVSFLMSMNPYIALFFFQIVRGILVDGSGKPTCHPLEAHLALHARLCVGACAVDRWGNIQSPAASADGQVPCQI